MLLAFLNSYFLFPARFLDEASHIANQISCCYRSFELAYAATIKKKLAVVLIVSASSARRWRSVDSPSWCLFQGSTIDDELRYTNLKDRLTSQGIMIDFPKVLLPHSYNPILNNDLHFLIRRELLLVCGLHYECSFNRRDLDEENRKSIFLRSSCFFREIIVLESAVALLYGEVEGLDGHDEEYDIYRPRANYLPALCLHMILKEHHLGRE